MGANRIKILRQCSLTNSFASGRYWTPTGRLLDALLDALLDGELTLSPPTKSLDFRGFDSSRLLILRGGILMSIGDFPESLSQAMLVGVMLVGGLGVSSSRAFFLRLVGVGELAGGMFSGFGVSC